MMKQTTARSVVLDALVRLEKDKSYSNIILDSSLKKNELSARDKAFASRLFYGVIERKLTLDYIVGLYASKSVELPVRVILWMGLYQLLYMETPDSAAANESVKLAAAVKPGAKGFVNAVLRRFIREERCFEEPKDPLKKLSVRYSCPEWLIKQYSSDYGDAAEGILATSLSSPPITLRVNPLKGTDEELIAQLSKEGIETEPVKDLTHCLAVKKGNPIASAAFSEGRFHVQDIASQLCALTVADSMPRRVFDLCAAPGGKTFTVAETLFGHGEVVAFDLHPRRVELIKTSAARLGLSNISAAPSDASVYNETFGTADCVLCDVPCAGLGVIRRKAEI